MTTSGAGLERAAKIVLAGTPGIGKSAIVQAAADAFEHAAVGVGEVGSATVYRAEFLWPESLDDGRRLRVGLFGLSGSPDYQAHWDLLLQGAAGIVFVASLHREDAHQTRAALQALVRGAESNQIDLRSTPIAMHYHARSTDGVLVPRELEEWLGIKAGSVKSYVTGRSTGEDRTLAVRGVVTELLRKQDPSAAAA